MTDEIFTRLTAPFNPADVEWRAGATNADKTKAMALAYVTSRAVMDRLDEVLGPLNWKDQYKPGPDGGLLCGISLRIDGEWLTKWDGAENTQFEAVKGGLSDAFKRAAVKWGIGRYLYKLPSPWVPCEVHGKTVVLKSTPTLPDWALVSDVGKKPAEKTVPFAEREQQILQELGLRSEWVPETQLKPKGNGNQRSWNADVVEAIVKAGLAGDPPEAVRLLNASSLPKDATPEEAVAWARSQH